MPIRRDTNTLGAPTKVDSDTSLAGQQRINGGIVGVEVHLPYSPAGGAPLYEVGFDEGHSWTEVEGSIHTGSGPSNNSAW